jgi:hypothetical protein
MNAAVARRQFLGDEVFAARRKTFETHYSVERPQEDEYRTDPHAQSIRIGDIPSAHYINAADPAQAEIRAYANTNPPPPQPTWLLSGSDLQFLQYKLAHGRGAEITPLQRIRRMNVASGTGAALMFYMKRLNKNYVGIELTPDNQENWQVEGKAETTVTATKSELFHAVLGTENAISAIWLVRDHGPRLGINGIQKVIAESGQNLAIYFSLM